MIVSVTHIHTSSSLVICFTHDIRTDSLFAPIHLYVDVCLRGFLSTCSKVESKYVLDLDDADIALLSKGDKVEGTG